MSRFNSRLLLATLALSAAVGCAQTADSFDGRQQDDSLTGTTSAERGIHFQGYLYLAPNADDSTIGTAVARQVKTAIGALRSPKVSLNDRAAHANLDSSKWTRSMVQVVDAANPSAPSQSLLKVTYRYDDRAVVTNALATRSSIGFTMLAGDYGAYADTLKTSCTDDPTVDTDSLWFHFSPESSTCKTKILEEANAIAAETQKLGGVNLGKIGPREAGRWFMPVSAKLDPPNIPSVKFAPEYDRLYGLGTDKQQVVVYAFSGVNGYNAQDAYDPDDVLGQEAIRFLRTVLRGQPNLRPVRTDPSVALLDIFVDGKRLDGVTFDRLFTWILDKKNYPAQVGSDAGKIADLRRQAISKFAERWVYWDVPLTVKDGAGAEKTITLELRSYYGQEDGSPEARQHAQWRYLEAFWHGDVFLYNGHSHFGHGPLEPTNFSSQNFNDRYQVMMINSCVSYNYYHQDFLDMKPGKTKNLDMVVNGLPSWVLGGGEAMGRLVTGLFDGTQKSYSDLLSSMRLDLPWEKAYDPMRVVDGELDNEYIASKRPLTVTAGAPLETTILPRDQWGNSENHLTFEKGVISSSSHLRAGRVTLTYTRERADSVAGGSKITDRSYGVNSYGCSKAEGVIAYKTFARYRINNNAAWTEVQMSRGSTSSKGSFFYLEVPELLSAKDSFEVMFRVEAYGSPNADYPSATGCPEFNQVKTVVWDNNESQNYRFIAAATDYRRTAILLNWPTQAGQDMFLRGGIDHAQMKARTGVTCTSLNYQCSIPMFHRFSGYNGLASGNPYTLHMRLGDTVLDWYGAESQSVIYARENGSLLSYSGQSSDAVGSPAEWTTNDPKNPNQVDSIGFGYTGLNTYGDHYWLLDVDADCSLALDDGTGRKWLEFKAFVSNYPQNGGWESDVSPRQSSLSGEFKAPYDSGNHFAQCGKLNVFRRNEGTPVAIKNFD